MLGKGTHFRRQILNFSFFPILYARIWVELSRKPLPSLSFLLLLPAQQKLIPKGAVVALLPSPCEEEQGENPNIALEWV